MHRITSLCLLALLAGSICITPALADRTSGRNHTILIADAVQIGWTKAQVEQALGKPSRTSKDKNIWYYGQRAIQFKNGKVSGFPGSAG